ncbi:MAG: hypothetical protein IH859_05555 [Chloroflexi bacterium]|nr:hypothetical protein [Chloroflexota bacterium]
MESEIQAVDPAPRLDDYLISVLGGFVVGVTAWVLAFAVVAVVQAAAPPGINILDTITAMKLAPPPGVDLSQITITIPIPKFNGIDYIFVAVPILFGLLAGWIGYRKVLKMD